jgi:hypothetical protein
MSDAPLEERIAAALGDDTNAADLPALIAETEEAIVVATENAELEREKALDPIASPDATAARAAMEDAQFRLGRLRTLLPRLQRRHDEAQQNEYLEKWYADYIAIEAERDALAAELRELYPSLAAKVVDLLTRIEANDAEISKLHQARPAGMRRHLRSAELEARNLDAFSRSAPSIVTQLQLPPWDETDAVKWPPPRLAFGVVMAQGMVFSPHPGADWGQANEERASERRVEQKRLAESREARAHAPKEREKSAHS